MTPKEKILSSLQGKISVTGPELSRALGVSRQALSRHLQKLIRDGRIEKEGSTKSARYRLADRRRPPPSPTRIEKVLRLEGLEEDAVFREVSLRLNLSRALSEPARRIVAFAFAELLNNAIEHSHSERCQLRFSLDAYDLEFSIRDFGIGLFHSIYAKFGLADEHAAVSELLKGKTTTMQERHSGEGIFFTSKAADRLRFRSHRTTLVFDNRKQDVYVEDGRFLRGTEVHFLLSRRSKRDLSQIFGQYAPEEFDYRFERTRVLTRVMLKDCVSRSEARRLLNGLDKFREVVLDFAGVQTIGQGFADEVFRVFLLAHPHTHIFVENLAPTLTSMVRHVVDNRTAERLTIR